MLSFPTLAFVLGIIAVAIALLGRRRVKPTTQTQVNASAWARRWNLLGLVLGTAAIICTSAVVVATTD
jgi:hypothetical protein